MRLHFFIKASFIVDTLQCCSKVGFIGGGGGGVQTPAPKARVARGSGGKVPRKTLKYSVSEIDILNSASRILQC